MSETLERGRLSLRGHVARIRTSIVQRRKRWTPSAHGGSDGAKVPQILVDRLSPDGHILVVVLGSFLGVPDPPVLIARDELLQTSGPASFLDEGSVEEILGRGTLLGVFAQAEVDKVLEGGGEVAFEHGRWVLGDQEEDLHGVDVGIGGLAVCQLQGGDAERPDVGLAVVARLLDDLGGHPEGGADEGVLLSHGGRELARDAKVGELDLAGCGDEDVGSCGC